MSDPTTSNILLAVPTRGSDVGTWDLPVNSNSTAIDGYFGGVQTISTTGGALTLTAPAGTVVVSAGPTQAQNCVLTFTGALTSDATITLPLPGYYIINNLTTTTSNKVLFFRAVGVGNVIAVDFGDTIHIYNDGTNVTFVNLARIASIQIWAGYAGVMPRWVTNCTVPPFLLCDGSVYNYSTYPALGPKLGSSFGGNGITTFGVPDLRGRVALPYDPVGRITIAGCGLNGTVIGATLDQQTFTLSTAQIPVHNHGVTDPTHAHQYGIQGTPGGSLVETVAALGYNNTGEFFGTTTSVATGITIQNTGGGLAHPNVQPSQVTGIAVIRAA